MNPATELDKAREQLRNWRDSPELGHGRIRSIQYWERRVRELESALSDRERFGDPSGESCNSHGHMWAPLSTVWADKAGRYCQMCGTNQMRDLSETWARKNTPLDTGWGADDL